MVFYGTTLMDGLIWKCYLLHYRQQILRYINTDYRWHSACLWVIEDRRTVHERSWVLDSTCCSMPKTAFVILFSNVTVLFSRVTQHFPLVTSPHSEDRYTKSRKYHILSPMHYAYTMNHRFNMAVRQLPQLCLG